MKKVFSNLAIAGILFLSTAQNIYSQTEQVVEDKTFHQVLKQRFIEGGPFFMGIVLVTLILGLAIAILFI